MSFFSSNLKYLRKLAGLSQEALAKQVKLNRGNIASYEKGAAEPKFENLLRLTRFFQVDLVHFLDKDLSVIVPENQIDLTSPEGVFLEIERESIQELLVEYGSTQQSLDSVHVLAKRLLALKRIIVGFKEYSNFRKTRPQQDVSEVLDSIQVDYDRLLELSENVIEIGRQLLKKYVEVSGPLSSNDGESA